MYSHASNILQNGIIFVFVVAKTRHLRKIFNILFVFFTLITSTFSQTVDPTEIEVSYKCLNKPLPIVLKELSKLSGVNIAFSESKFANRKTVTINVENEKLINVLDVILKPYRYQIEIIGDNIAVVSSRSQETNKEYIINGFVKAKSDAEFLPYASVYLDDKSSGVVSNEKGFYSLKLKRGTYNLVYSYIGYFNDTLRLILNRDTTINRLLKEENLLKEVTVAENQTKSAIRYGEEYFAIDKLGVGQMMGGESDILRSINASAGVSSGSDGFAGLSVRGGNYDQNLILYDGVPILNTGHAFGLVSIFNSGIIQDARLIKGGIPARYSGRLSSIIDVKTKEGNKKFYEGELSVSLLTSKASFQGPIVKDKSSFYVGYRRTYLDPWIKRVSSVINDASNSLGGASYFFDDINAKFNFQIGKKHHLILSYYQGSDQLGIDRSFKQISSMVEYGDASINENQWKNRIVSLHFNSQLGKRMYGKFTLYHSDWKNKSFDFNRFEEKSKEDSIRIFKIEYKNSSLTSNGAKYDIDFQMNRSNLLRFGVGLVRYNSLPQFLNLTSAIHNVFNLDKITSDSISKNLIKTEFSSNEINSYVENEMTLSQGVILNLGAHISLYQANKKIYKLFQPRINLRIFGENSWFNLASSYMGQYQHAVGDNAFSFPTDFWVNSSENIKPATGLNNTINIGFNLGKNISLNFAGYYKTMNNIIALGEGEPLELDTNGDWQKFLPRGKGSAYGGEAGLDIYSSIVNLKLNYTYGKSMRDFFESLNAGKTFFYKYDRTHVFNAYLGFQIGESTEISVFTTYQTGNATSIPTGEIIVNSSNGQDFLTVVINGKNNQRFQNNVRLDLGFTFMGKNKAGNHKVFAGFYNLLNNLNPLFLEIRRNNFELSAYEVNKVSILPLMPSISYTYNFHIIK